MMAGPSIDVVIAAMSTPGWVIATSQLAGVSRWSCLA